jgi:ABC-type glycerol-3-phosphate transport system substrate-binding protein
MAAAPDLMGRWAMAPIPGVLRDDGTVDRSTAGYVGEADVILSASNKKDACWQFIKWWTSAETQTKFGREVEGRIGSHARWLSSNAEAFSGMPWNRDDLKVIQSSWSAIVETPNVLGGYFTGRHLTNAWNRTVVGGMSARDSLEICVEDINNELLRRQQQYAFN